jgi:hypothetical protein
MVSKIINADPGMIYLFVQSVHHKVLLLSAAAAKTPESHHIQLYGKRSIRKYRPHHQQNHRTTTIDHWIFHQNNPGVC